MEKEDEAMNINILFSCDGILNIYTIKNSQNMKGNDPGVTCIISIPKKLSWERARKQSMIPGLAMEQTTALRLQVSVQL